MAGTNRITAGDGLRTDRECGRRCMIRDGSRPEMDRDQIWMDHERRMTINLVSYMKLQGSNWAQNGRHTLFRRHRSTKYDSKHYPEMPN